MLVVLSILLNCYGLLLLRQKRREIQISCSILVPKLFMMSQFKNFCSPCCCCRCCNIYLMFRRNRLSIGFESWLKNLEKSGKFKLVSWSKIGWKSYGWFIAVAKTVRIHFLIFWHFSLHGYISAKYISSLKPVHKYPYFWRVLWRSFWVHIFCLSFTKMQKINPRIRNSKTRQLYKEKSMFT